MASYIRKTQSCFHNQQTSPNKSNRKMRLPALHKFEQFKNTEQTFPRKLSYCVSFFLVFSNKIKLSVQFYKKIF